MQKRQIIFSLFAGLLLSPVHAADNTPWQDFTTNEPVLIQGSKHIAGFKAPCTGLFCVQRSCYTDAPVMDLPGRNNNHEGNYSTCDPLFHPEKNAALRTIYL